MFTQIKHGLLALASAVPPLLVCVALAGVAYWGHATEWKAPKFSTLIGAEDANDDDDKAKAADAPVTETTPGPPDWCEKHQVSDSLCTACHPELAAGKSPAPPSGDEPAIRPSHSPQECRTHLEVIRFPSQDALRMSGAQTAAVRTQTLTDTVAAHGMVEYDPTLTVKLGPKAGGTVWRVYKRLGDRVRPGEVLALIDAAEVGKAKSEYLQTAVYLDTRQRVLKALQQSSSSPQRTLAEAETAVRESRARLYTAQQVLLNLGLPLKGDEASLPDEQLARRLQLLGLPAEIIASLPADTTTANLLPLTAPRAGVVIERKAETGGVVAALQPLFTVSDTSEMHVHLDIRPEDIHRLSAGQRVEFRPEGDPRPASGRLHWIDTALDEKTRLAHAHAEFANPDGRLRANVFGDATVTVGVRESATVVPAEAVQWEGCSYVVFVRESDLAFRPRKVRLGLRQNGVAEVLAGGVKPGDVVATAGSHVLKSHLLRDRLGAAED